MGCYSILNHCLEQLQKHTKQTRYIIHICSTHFHSSSSSIYLSICTQYKMVRALTTSSSMGIRQQKPNRFTRVFQEMKSSCPSQITTYAQCVLKEETSGGELRGACEQEFAHVKDCFRQVRLQNAML
jgi:hypothetical protein